MTPHEVENEWPAIYEQLKVSVNRPSNWRERLDAVEKLGQWKNGQSIVLLKHRMNNDAVHSVQQAAYRQLQQFGEDIQPPPRKDGELIKGLTKILIRIKKSLPADHSYEQFRDKLKKMRIDVYDTYEGDKGAEFDTWLEHKWASLSAR